MLLDDSGGEIARFRQVERENRVADLFTLSDGVEPEHAAARRDGGAGGLADRRARSPSAGS